MALQDLGDWTNGVVRVLRQHGVEGGDYEGMHFHVVFYGVKSEHWHYYFRAYINKNLKTDDAINIVGVYFLLYRI